MKWAWLVVVGIACACGHSRAIDDAGSDGVPEPDADEGVGARIAIDLLGVRDPMTATLTDTVDQTTQSVDITEDGPRRFPRRLATGHGFTIALSSGQTCMPGSITDTAGADSSSSIVCDGVVSIDAIDSMDPLIPLRFQPAFDPQKDQYLEVFGPLLADPGTSTQLAGSSHYQEVALAPTAVDWKTGILTSSVSATTIHAPFGAHDYTMTISRKLLEELVGKAVSPAAFQHLGGINDATAISRGYRGAGLALSGDTLVVGIPGGFPPATGPGGAQVFRRHGLHWILEAAIAAPVPTTNFGATVAIDGDTLVVGAPRDSAHGTAYVYQRTGTVWTQVAMLRPPTLASNAQDGALFGGGGIAIAKPFIVIGAPNQTNPNGSKLLAGAAYVFHDDGAAGWNESQTLLSDIADEHLGSAVAITANRLAVGAPGGTTNCCAVYTYAFGTDWTLDQRIPQPGVGPTDFGTAVALAGDLLVVGSPLEDPGNVSNAGVARVYHRATTWTVVSTLGAPGVQAVAQFGHAVGLVGHHVVVGAPGQDRPGAVGAGTVHYFRCSDTGTCPAAEASPFASNANQDARFGSSIAIAGTTFAVGAPNEDTGGQDSGAVYIYR